MDVEHVALTPKCEECDEAWLPADEERRLAIWVDDGPDERLLFYCREWPEREFGGQ
jgi:hypothetical protein